MTTNIVTVNVSQQVAPAPNLLQQTGAFISQGATTLPAGTASLLTQLSSLTSLLAAAAPLATLSWSGGTATATVPSDSISSGTYNSGTGLVTLTLSAPLNLSPGQYVFVSGATGTGSFASIDGLFTAGVGTTGSTVTYTIATSLTMTITGGTAYASHGQATSSTFLTTIAGATPSNYNGTYLATATSNTQFTYALSSDGGTTPATGSITYTPYNQAELVLMNTTFWAQGSATPVYVLELGPGTATQGVTALTSYMANTNAVPRFYSFLVPANWDANSSFIALAQANASTTSKVYFFVTTTLGTYTDYAPGGTGIKSIFWMVPTPGDQTTAFDLASVFWVTLSYAPSSVNMVTPLCFSYLVGVNAYTTLTSTQTAAIKAAFGNYVWNGAEGGISNTILEWGTNADGNPFGYWYAADWAQIQSDLALSNAIINGSNNPQAPLYYNQAGINTLQSVAQSVLANGTAFGLFNGTPVVNAVPYATYVKQNPSDYATGTYKGLSATIVPLRGFEAITFFLTVSNIPTA